MAFLAETTSGTSTQAFTGASAAGAGASQAAGTSGGIGNLLNVTGTLASGFSQFQTAQENEAIEHQNAIRSLQSTEDRVRETRRKTGKLHGKQVSQFLFSGVELEGSPLLVLEETLTLGEQDVQAIRDDGETKAKQSRLRAKSIRTKGRATLAGSLFKAGSTALTKKQTAISIT